VLDLRCFFRFSRAKKALDDKSTQFRARKWPSSTTPPKQRTVQGKAGAYAGTKKYGEAANLPISAMKKKSVSSALKASRSGGASAPSPRSSRGEGRGEGRDTGGANASPSKVHKPHLDEMHGPESLPYRPDRTTPRQPSPDSGSKSSSPPTPAKPAPSSALRHVRAVARRGTGVGGRRGKQFGRRRA